MDTGDVMIRGVNRRLHGEVKQLLRYYPMLEYNECSPFASFEKSIIIAFNKDTFCFTISRCYPFKPPTLHVNGVEIITLLHKYQVLLSKIYGNPEECICIRSLFCSSNWSPGIKILDLMNHILKEKVKIQNKYKEQYIIPILLKNNIHEKGIFINIMSFYEL
tara:strand:+ start:21 stop:506 length:486 start_codon:yes stop_codon:yes gene_type:complete